MAGRQSLPHIRTESGFTAPEKISNSAKNEWNPAIAADKAGRVAVAWDSYRNGNYDVYARTWSNSWAAEVPIAASARYEAYPSIAFDPKGRLWVAYEEGGEGWGQDFGAYASPGIALYKGRAIRLRALEPDGRLVTIQSSIDKSLVGIPSARPDITGSQLDGEPRDPDTQSAAHPQTRSGPRGGRANHGEEHPAAPDHRRLRADLHRLPHCSSHLVESHRNGVVGVCDLL